MNRAPGSLRTRLAFAMAAGIAVLMAGLGCSASWLLERHTLREFDAALLARARNLAALTEQEGANIEFDYVARFQPEFERAHQPEYFQFWLDNGEILVRSRWLDEDLLDAPTLVDEPRSHDRRLATGRLVRVVHFTVTPKTPGEDPFAALEPENHAPLAPLHRLVVAVARGREPLDEMLASMHVAVLATGGLATAIGWLLVWLVVAAGCRPIVAMSRQVRDLGADDPNGRVLLPDAPRELTPVVEQLNLLLDRLHEAVQRERRFAGNVAHELRTPVAELRTLASVGARWPDDPKAVAGFFGDVHQVAGRMEAVIRDLLLLARCQGQGGESVAAAPVAVRQAVQVAWRQFHAAVEQARLSLRLDIDSGLVIQSDPGKFAILCANLVGNAIGYGTPGTAIVCRASATGDRFSFEIENAAVALAPEELQRLCEPFWRHDPARASAEHAGLGLSLVDAIARLLQFELRFAQDGDGTFRVRIAGPIGNAPVLAAVLRDTPTVRRSPFPAAANRLQGEAS